MPLPRGEGLNNNTYERGFNHNTYEQGFDYNTYGQSLDHNTNGQGLRTKYLWVRAQEFGLT